MSLAARGLRNVWSFGGVRGLRMLPCVGDVSYIGVRPAVKMSPRRALAGFQCTGEDEKEDEGGGGGAEAHAGPHKISLR